MTDTNRGRVALWEQATFGVTPGSPVARICRITGENLAYQPVYFTSEEIRSDRMSPDPTKINEKNDGGINFEVHYPTNTCELHSILASAFLNAWTDLPVRDNDGTADSVITNVDNTTQTVTVTTGGTFVIGHLVRQTGYTAAANNGLFRVTTGGATSYICVGAGMVLEAAPPATARSKVVGARGASADITATANGISCTALNFLNIGIIPGMWIKVGGTAVGEQFATAALNNWIRVVSVTATAIVADNLPAGWTTDAGTGKTISLFFGDVLRNGTTLRGLEIERGFLGQAAPTYIVQRSMAVDRLTLGAETGKAITGTCSFMGLVGAQGTAAYGSTYVPATTSPVMNGNVNVGRIAIGGTTVGSPNWATDFSLEIANNLRVIDALGNVGGVTLGTGEIGVTGTIGTYFGSNSYLTQLFAGTPAQISIRSASTHPSGGTQAIILTLPRVTMTSGNPNITGKNADVKLNLGFTASIDTVTNCEVDFQRVEYYE